MVKFSVSERFACKVLGQHRSTQRKKPQSRPDEEALTTDIIRLASRYGRYGYRRITAMLRSEGWTVGSADTLMRDVPTTARIGADALALVGVRP